MPTDVYASPDDTDKSSITHPPAKGRPLKRKVPLVEKNGVVELDDSDDDAEPEKLKRPRKLPSEPPEELPKPNRRVFGVADLAQLEHLRRQRRRVKAEAEAAAAAAQPMQVDTFYGTAGSDLKKDTARRQELNPIGEGSSRSTSIAVDDDDAPTPVAPLKKLEPLKFAKGVVKKTWCEGKPIEGSEIKIEDILEKTTLRTAVLSAFQWDYQWIMGKLPLHNKLFRMTLVMQGKEPEEKMQRREMFEGLPRTTLVFPPMEPQVNCMHSKLMLLFHKRKDEKEFLRIAVPSANLTDYDWGEKGVYISEGGFMENSVFIIDLPRLPEINPAQTPFMDELLRFCGAKGISDELLNEVIHYDFKKTAGYAFVHSIGGTHEGDDWQTTGICGLAKAISDLGLKSRSGLEVDFVTSSLGALKKQFVSDMYRAAQGHNGLRELKRRHKKKPKKSQRTLVEDSTTDEDELGEERDWNKIKERFRVYFPSRDTVLESWGKMMNAGTVCFQEKWWHDKSFPKELVRDCRSTRLRLLMHNKMLFARPAHELQSTVGRVGAWAYVGSANLSESAWGKLVMDRTKKTPKLNCKNWECGVIVPILVKDLKRQSGQTLSGAPPPPPDYPVDLAKIEPVVPVPMIPGEAMEGKTPWFFAELHRMLQQQ